MIKRSIIVLMAALLLFGTTGVAQGAERRNVLLAAYSVPKEVYEKRIIPAFERDWKQRTGETIRISASFAASGAQARAILGGLEADVAALSLENDLQQLVKGGLVRPDWKKAPHNGIVTTSVVVIGVRKGNPKQIKGWEDLTRSGVDVLYPSPKTSGGAMWDIAAIYGAGLKLARTQSLSNDAAEAFAARLVKDVQRNVKVMDKSGRESVTTFERGIGDAIVTYENELVPRVKEGRPYEIIVPAQTILVENPVAVVERHADRHQVRDVAEAFVSFLFTEEAQRAFADFGFRPVHLAAAGTVTAFVRPLDLFTLSDLGGWDRVFESLFSPRGLWTAAVEDLARNR